MGLGLVDKPHLQRFKTKLDEYFVKKTDKATSEEFGVVKVDGTTITSNNGVLSGYTLPEASKTVLGGVMIDDETIKIADGVISATAKNADYSSTEQLTGSKWIDDTPIHRVTYILNAPISCTGGQWNEICSEPEDISVLVWGSYTDGDVTGCTVKKDNGKIYVFPNVNCSVTYLTIDYTKIVREYMYDYTWAEASTKTWGEFSNSEWKGAS